MDRPWFPNGPSKIPLAGSKRGSGTSAARTARTTQGSNPKRFVSLSALSGLAAGQTSGFHALIGWFNQSSRDSALFLTKVPGVAAANQIAGRRLLRKHSAALPIVVGGHADGELAGHPFFSSGFHLPENHFIFANSVPPGPRPCLYEGTIRTLWGTSWEQ